MPHQLQDVGGGRFFKSYQPPPLPPPPSRFHVPWGSFIQANFTRTSSAETGRHRGRLRTQTWARRIPFFNRCYFKTFEQPRTEIWASSGRRLATTGQLNITTNISVYLYRMYLGYIPNYYCCWSCFPGCQYYLSVSNEAFLLTRCFFVFRTIPLASIWC